MQQQQETTTQDNKEQTQCVELKNIEYQTMLMNKNSNSSATELRPKSKQNISLNDVNDMLDTEQSGTSLPWSRLTKSKKITKINEYIDTLKEKCDLNMSETKEIKTYIKKCFDRKMLKRANDIVYDKHKKFITDIPSLIILDKEKVKLEKRKKRFTIKLRNDKSSTLKNLSKGKTSTKKELMMKMAGTKE